MTHSRRQYLGSLATGGCLLLAGCQSRGSSEDDEATPADAPAEFQLGETTLNPDTPIRLENRDTDELVVRIHGHGDTAHWHRSPLTLSVGQWQRYEIVFRNFDGEQLPLGDGEQYQATVSLVDDADFVDIDHTGTELDLRGTEAGGASLRIQLVEDDDPQWTPSDLSLSVQG